MSFWYGIYYDLSTSASWKIKEKSKILGTFPDTFFKMATDIIFHWFLIDLDSILGCFLKLKSEKIKFNPYLVMKINLEDECVFSDKDIERLKKALEAQSVIIEEVRRMGKTLYR